MTCITPTCDKPVKSRGLCHACNMCAGRYVRSRQATWKELEKAGFALPTKKGKARRAPWARWVVDREGGDNEN